MAYRIFTTNQFERDLKRCIRRGCPMDEFRKVISLLEQDGKLPIKYNPINYKAIAKDSGNVT